jgi:hypothetical protein
MAKYITEVGKPLISLSIKKLTTTKQSLARPILRQ